MTKLQLTEDERQVAVFLAFVGPALAEALSDYLQARGFEIVKIGEGIRQRFTVRNGVHEATLFLRNLFLEIATVDGHEEPLQFDTKLREFDYFTAKATHVVDSKIRLLARMLETENMDEVLEGLDTEYGKVKILRIDKKGDGHGYTLPGGTWPDMAIDTETLEEPE